MNELSLIRFHTTNFFAIILNSRPFQPTATILIKIVKSLIDSEAKPDEKHKARVDWIYKNTHSDVKQHISVIELAVFKNIDKGLNRELTIEGKDYPLISLYQYLDEVSLELAKIVIEISKRYSFDIPMITMGSSSSSINLEK